MIKKGNMTDAEYIAALEKEHIREIRRLETYRPLLRDIN